MNCEDIRNRLSEYLDKSLDAISAKNIEIHLSACPFCRAEAAALADCIRQVRALPTVEPPFGFSQRVMAHVREIEIKPTLWQRLFLPLKIKIPIQAMAVVLIAGLAFLLSQKQEQPQSLDRMDTGTLSAASSNLEATQSQATPESNIVPQDSVRERSTAKPETKESARFARQFVDQAKSAETQTAQPPAAASPSASFEAVKAELERRVEAKPMAPRRPPIQAQEVVAGRESSRFEQFIMDIPGARSQPSLRAAPLAAARAPSPLGELSADVEFVVRRRGTDHLNFQRSDSHDTAQALAARQRGPAAILSSIAEIRWFSVQRDLYESFKKELAAEASIESERPITPLENDSSQKPSRELLIKVIILSPTER